MSMLCCRAAEEMIESVVSSSELPLPPPAEENEGGPEVMKKFFTLNEDFRGKIKDNLLQHEISRVGHVATSILPSQAGVLCFLHDFSSISHVA